MSTFRQFWGKLFSRSKKPTDADGQPTASPEELEREISAISGERQALAEEVHQVRSNFERARDEDHRKLTEFESLNHRYETAREADSRKILDLERRLAALESEHRQAHDKSRALQAAVGETTSRLEKADLQVKDLQVGSVEQAKQFKASLSDASNRLEATDTHVRELEDRLNSERQDYLNTIQGTLDRFRRQDLRMNWTMSGAGIALLLGTVAGVILMWDMKRNTTVLSSMSRDLGDMMSSIEGHQGLQHKLYEEQPRLVRPAVSAVPPPPPPVARTTVAAPPIKSPAPKPRSAAPARRVGFIEPASNPYYLGTALNRGRPGAFDIRRLSTTRDREREEDGYLEQNSYGEVDSFFEENAKVEGVISLPSGVQYRVVKSGTGQTPLLTDRVVVEYVGMKLDGAIFDESHSSGEPSTFGMYEVTPGLQEVLWNMAEGAEFEFYVPESLLTMGAEGKRGALGYEPGVYLIELLQVIRGGATASATKPV